MCSCARAADELKTGRRSQRVPVSETDANPYRIPHSGMVAVGKQDWYKEERIAEDDTPDPVNDMDVPPGAADTDEGGDRPGLHDFRHCLHAMSPNRPSRRTILSVIAAATGPPAGAGGVRPPAERKPTVRIRRVMLSPTEIAALGKYQMIVPEEWAVAPEW